jgi:cell filamentation protein, protein adenylyltransferase
MDKPPYIITSRILNLVAAISERVGAARAVHLDIPVPLYKKRNRIRTIQSSLEIEGNTLSIEQITAVLDGNRVVGPKKDILEAKNATRLYNLLDAWNPYKLTDLCKAHKIMMKGLVEHPGRLRSGTVGIVKGKQITHLAPDSEMVSPLLKSLLKYAKTDADSPLIRSCVFHYEFEFIHPFADGNGRMGRLWQTLLLRESTPLFEYLPIEPLINARRGDYYNALATSDREGQSTRFVEFMLDIIDSALKELLRQRPIPLSGEKRMERFAKEIGKNQFSRKDYMQQFKEISPATASRDLVKAVKKGVLERQGDKRKTTYRFKLKCYPYSPC